MNHDYSKQKSKFIITNYICINIQRNKTKNASTVIRGVFLNTGMIKENSTLQLKLIPSLKNII